MNKLAGLVKPTNKAPKYHKFISVTSKSQEKGKLYKSPSGLYMIADVTKMVYRCPKCDSEIELAQKVDPRTLNKQLSERFTCK